MRGARRVGAALAALAAVLALAAVPAPAAGSPFAGAKLFVDPKSDAAKQVHRWNRSRSGAAAALRRISTRPQADWFDGSGGAVRKRVGRRAGRIRRAGALPLLVAYNLPHRDCGGHSGGGAGSARGYRSWIRGFAGGIGKGSAAVVLEPDALAKLDCLSRGQRRARLASLRRGVATLGRRSGAGVYLDAGHSGWVPAQEMASRLRQAGIAKARGFALNVSNFRSTQAEVAYGQEVSRRLGGKPFVVDTSRNGLGPGSSGKWCNPPGRALGAAPAIAPGPAGVDAYLWVKPPGESDGRCNGGPEAGRFWPSYALGLAKRARG